MKKLFAIALVALVSTTVFTSCKKDSATPVVTSCIPDNIGGRYTGNLLVLPSVSKNNAVVNITKLSCTSATIESASGDFAAITVNSLAASTTGSYVGTTSTNKQATFTINGANIEVSIGQAEISFQGAK